MRRWLLGLAAASFLAFIGLEASHFHAKTLPDSCAVCQLGTQGVAAAPQECPFLAQELSWSSVAFVQPARASSGAPLAAPARSPPLA